MRRTRRQVLAATAGGATLGTAGCLDLVLGTGPAEFAATEPRVTDGALAAAGYEHVGTDAQVLEQQIEVEDRTRTVQVTNYLAQYRHPLAVPEQGTVEEAAVFTAFATPRVEVLGRTINPIASLDVAELAKRLLLLYAAVTIREQVGRLELEALGEVRQFTRYAGLVTVGDVELDSLLELNRLQRGADVLVLLGAYPEARSAEEENLATLVGGLEHGE